MAETNKSKLMSEAEIIEAINSDSLVSVSLGAGQPQKNVKMSTLASVVAGIIPTNSQFYKKSVGAWFDTNNEQVIVRLCEYPKSYEHFCYRLYTRGNTNYSVDLEIYSESNTIKVKNVSKTSGAFETKIYHDGVYVYVANPRYHNTFIRFLGSTRNEKMYLDVVSVDTSSMTNVPVT